jgi:hypothetical protein
MSASGGEDCSTRYKRSGKVMAGQFVRVLLRSHVFVHLGSGLKFSDLIKPLKVLVVND